MHYNMNIMFKTTYGIGPTVCSPDPNKGNVRRNGKKNPVVFEH